MPGGNVSRYIAIGMKRWIFFSRNLMFLTTFYAYCPQALSNVSQKSKDLIQESRCDTFVAKVWRNIYFVPLFEINFWEGCRQVCFKKSYVWHIQIKKLHAIMRIMLSMPPSLHSLFYIRFLLPYSIKPKNIWHVDSENVFKKFLWYIFSSFFWKSL